MKQLILINNIGNPDEFKSFKYKAKLLANTGAQSAPNRANGILKMQYLSNQGIFGDHLKCH